jgi:hypothetical protein
MLTWILDNRSEFLYNYTEIGDDLEMAHELREEPKQFETNCGDVQTNIDRVSQVGQRLRTAEYYDVDLIDRLSTRLECEWKKLYLAVQRRSQLLDSSVSFHTSSDKYLSQSQVWLEELTNIENQDILTSEEMKKSLLDHDKLKTVMGDMYDSVSSEAQKLLGVLQQSPSSERREEKAKSRLSDYTEAAEHVMRVIVTMYESNKQLKILWEKMSVRIRQKHHLALFERDCSEILKWVRGNGHQFLNKYSWVGDKLEVAEELLVEQEHFEKSFDETYGKAKKLLESALHLAETKECDPVEIKAKVCICDCILKQVTELVKVLWELSLFFMFSIKLCNCKLFNLDTVKKCIVVWLTKGQI